MTTDPWILNVKAKLATVAWLLFCCLVSSDFDPKPRKTMGRRHHREKKMTEKEADENLTAKLEESGYREELKKKV